MWGRESLYDYVHWLTSKYILVVVVVAAIEAEKNYQRWWCWWRTRFIYLYANEAINVSVHKFHISLFFIYFFSFPSLFVSLALCVVSLTIRCEKSQGRCWFGWLSRCCCAARPPQQQNCTCVLLMSRSGRHRTANNMVASHNWSHFILRITEFSSGEKRRPKWKEKRNKINWERNPSREIVYRKLQLPFHSLAFGFLLASQKRRCCNINTEILLYRCMSAPQPTIAYLRIEHMHILLSIINIALNAVYCAVAAIGRFILIHKTRALVRGFCQCK